MDGVFAINSLVEVDIMDLEVIIDHDEARKSKAFLITDAVFADPGLAACVAAGQRVPGTRTIRDLDANAETQIMNCMKNLMKEVPDTERFMLVIDLSSFPYLTSLIHRGVPEKDGNKFTGDVYNAWSTYDMSKEIPVIIVNVEIPHTGLKMLPLPWSDSS
jgi:hypothetical protein